MIFWDIPSYLSALGDCCYEWMITCFYWLCPETVNGLHPWVSRHALSYVLAACVHSCPASAPHRLLLVSVFPVIPWLRKLFSAVQTGINVNSCWLICCSAPMPYLIGVHTSLMEVGFTTWALRPPSLSLYIHHCIFPIHPKTYILIIFSHPCPDVD